MSFLTEIFSPNFEPVKLGNYLLANLHQYIEYMRTPCFMKDPFKWGGFLEILAASIIFGRPVQVHVMDRRPEFKICYYEDQNTNDPILLSYEGGDHYNAITKANHSNIESRPGVKELMTLSASVLKKVFITKTKIPKMYTNAELDVILSNKTIKF